MTKREQHEEPDLEQLTNRWDELSTTQGLRLTLLALALLIKNTFFPAKRDKDKTKKPEQ